MSSRLQTKTIMGRSWGGGRARILRMLGWVGCAVLLGLASLAYADTLPEIEYAAPEQSVWTTRFGPGGQLNNPLFPVATALFSRAGIPWHARSYPAARMFRYLEEGKAHFSILVRSPALSDCCLLSRKPVASTDIRVYHLERLPPVRALQDLQGKSVIVIHGYSYGGLLAALSEGPSPITPQLAMTHSAAFRMLQGGRADYVVDYAGPAGEVLADAPIPGVRWENLSRQEVFLVLSRAYPDAPRVMARLESILDTLDVDRLMRSPRP